MPSAATTGDSQMSDTTDQIEREVEMRRAEVGATLDRIKSRTTLDALLTDIGGYLHVQDARQVLQSAGNHVRQNPAAVGLVAAGLGWLVFGGMTPARDDAAARDDRDRMYPPHRDNAGGNAGVAGAYDQVADAAEGVVDRVSASVTDAAGAVRDTVGSAAGAISGAASGAMRDTRSATADLARQAQGHPLLVGSAMTLLGAVIAAALPRTETESSLLDGPRQTILREGKRVVSDAADMAAGVAARTTAAARDAASEQGLWPQDDGTTLGEKIGTVADAAVDAARQSVDDAVTGLTGTDAGPDPDSGSDTGEEPAPDPAFPPPRNG
jgi:hypothetical protein